MEKEGGVTSPAVTSPNDITGWILSSEHRDALIGCLVVGLMLSIALIVCCIVHSHKILEHQTVINLRTSPQNNVTVDVPTRDAEISMELDSCPGRANSGLENTKSKDRATLSKSALRDGRGCGGGCWCLKKPAIDDTYLTPVGPYEHIRESMVGTIPQGNVGNIIQSFERSV